MGSQDPVEILNSLGARWSSNLDDYASGKIDAHELVCVLCNTAPCSCVTCSRHGMSTRSCGC
jgi:hypothetical protein